MENIEIWKPIKDYPDYIISNYGMIKSLKFGKERLMKCNVNNIGYVYVVLYHNGIQKTLKVHQLVSIAFLNHEPCGFKYVVNHKDFNRLNNRVDNLEIVTTRDNTNQKHMKSTSKYTGVHWCNRSKKWVAQIVELGKNKHLGYFINEYDAHLAYEKKLTEIN